MELLARERLTQLLSQARNGTSRLEVSKQLYLIADSYRNGSGGRELFRKHPDVDEADELNPLIGDFLYSNALEICKFALKNMQTNTDLPLSSWEESLSSFTHSCKLLNVLNDFPEVAVKLQPKISCVVPQVFQRLQELYDHPPTPLVTETSTRLEMKAYYDESASLFEAASSLSLLAAIGVDASEDSRMKVVRFQGFAALAFTIWARHHKKDDGDCKDLQCAFSFLYCLTLERSEPCAGEDNRSAYCRAFGDGAQCAKSFDSVLRRLSQPGNQFHVNLRTVRFVFEFLYWMTCHDLPCHHDFQVALRKCGVHRLATSYIVLIGDEIRQETKMWPKKIVQDALAACLYFLSSCFQSHDGELWAIDPVRKDLLFNLFSLEDIMPNLDETAFAAYLDIFHGLRALLKNERFFKATSQHLMKIWSTEKIDLRLSDEELYARGRGSPDRQLLETEFFWQAYVNRLRHIGRTLFRPACTNPTCSKSSNMAGAPLKKCGLCKSTLYCSRGCQREAWPMHKKYCNQIAAEGRLTGLAHRDRMNNISTAFYAYLHDLGNANAIDPKDSLYIDARLPLHCSGRKRFQDGPDQFARNLGLVGETLRHSELFGLRSIDDVSDWATLPALARHLRECAAERLRNGFHDRIIVECVHRDNQKREDNEPGVSYTLVRVPEDDENVPRIVSIASHMAGIQIRRSANKPGFKRAWNSGTLLDFVYERAQRLV